MENDGAIQVRERGPWILHRDLVSVPGNSERAEVIFHLIRSMKITGAKQLCSTFTFSFQLEKRLCTLKPNINMRGTILHKSTVNWGFTLHRIHRCYWVANWVINNRLFSSCNPLCWCVIRGVCIGWWWKCWQFTWSWWLEVCNLWAKHWWWVLP